MGNSPPLQCEQCGSPLSNGRIRDGVFVVVCAECGHTTRIRIPAVSGRRPHAATHAATVSDPQKLVIDEDMLHDNGRHK